MAEQQAYVINYDIPKRKKKTIGNPRPFLRRRAVYVQLSSCVTVKDRIPHVYLDEMRRKGATVDILPIDPHGYKAIVKIVRRQLRAEAEQMATAAEDSMREGAAKVRGRARKDPKKAGALFRSAANRSLAKLAENFESMTEAARLFGIDVDSDLQKALGQVRLTHARTAARVRVILAAAEKARAKGGEAARMADALEADEAPPLIAADLFEEAGIDVDELREEFAERL